MQSGYIDVEAHRIYYYRYGEVGPKIVLLHGFGHISNSLNLRQFLEDMSDSYQILAFDLLAHGRSSDPKSPVGFEEHARIMHQAATELGYEKYNLIGYSFGGWISMRTAAIYSDSIEKLVIIDVTPITYKKPNEFPSRFLHPKNSRIRNQLLNGSQEDTLDMMGVLGIMILRMH